jgi:hypothetical protein
MEHVAELMTRLALDPFASLALRDAGVATLDGTAVGAAALRAALAATDAAAIAGPDWAACETCCDPGTDDSDPFGG